MTATPAIRIGIVDSMELALARRSAAETLAELVRNWNNPLPEAVVAAARSHLAVAENWARLRREAPEAEKVQAVFASLPSATSDP
ncbi:hypothetical protein [Arthrobacter crystallopoietes]|uniref:Uncharacterized protein n=1 Tax=Crystallibacter crystallopoietes TaxID=37928 RepID=A0A1H0ZPH3_9MICC|nr:hypothetical protein [Arthrobacter crystallopoietes]AUI51894.1 hypothetical protein AC20117_14945 [Arthrobacter crystallopoietes]SDQ28926.1 hypothetical protein SAMN04489742_0469 [Arthrobacter crystallopoietes]